MIAILLRVENNLRNAAADDSLLNRGMYLLARLRWPSYVAFVPSR